MPGKEVVPMNTVRVALTEAIGRLELLLAQHAQYQVELADLQRYLCRLTLRLDKEPYTHESV